MSTSANRTWSHLVVVLLALAAPCASALAQAVQPDRPQNIIGVDVGQSTVVKPPWPVVRVSVTQPEIADVRVLAPDQVLVLGQAVGSTDLLMWNQQEELWQGRIIVNRDYTQLREQLRKLFPGARLELHPQGDVVAITGMLARADQAPQLKAYLDGTKVNYIDLTRVAGVHQVHVKVKVAEVSRRAIRALGANFLYTGNDFIGGQQIGPDGGGPLNPFGSIPSDTIPISSGVTVFGIFRDEDFSIFVQALSENQYLRILAEPDLVALSGEEASFLAGGEFPIPIVQGGTADATSISIEYKEFGVRLRFRPTVLGDGTIRMFVAPEVSELTDVGAVVIQGFRIPALNTRRAETTLELKSGQTFGMAGLLSSDFNARNSRIPGFGDVPILGALFRSVRHSSGETELVVLVTATLVEPVSDAPPVPGMNHTEPNDWEFYGLGKLEGEPDRLAPEYVQWMHECGIPNLKGPGGWAGYGDKPSAMRTSSKAAAPTTAPAGQ